ncbi:hypothetical protein N6H14_11535 [Paenibacillus sp. CC-CFT747]|nr:hypothetical protein N6H14_11535 [Paenibacillus sp. CC-CFT747]
MITSFDRRLPAGYVLNGKWNRNRYEVVRRLGSGANGAVFLVRREKTEYALKIGFDAVDHQSEINVLADLSGREGAFSGYLKDVDDVLIEGRPTLSMS